MKKAKIYFNIFIALLFMALGVYLITMSDDETKIAGIPFRIVIGFAGIVINFVLCLKWINRLKTAS